MNLASLAVYFDADPSVAHPAHLDWPNLLVGALLGFILGIIAAYIAHSSYDKKQAARKAAWLKQKYGKLAGAYSNFRPDGSPTTGSVELKQNPDGSFGILGLHADRTVEWESTLWMDEKFENYGTARYQYRAANNNGIQLIRYFPETEELHASAERESPGPLRFSHVWRRRK